MHATKQYTYRAVLVPTGSFATLSLARDWFREKELTGWKLAMSSYSKEGATYIFRRSSCAT